MVPVLCENALGYIMQIYDGKCGISAGTVGFMLQPFERKATTFTRTITRVSNLQKPSRARTSECVELSI